MSSEEQAARSQHAFSAEGAAGARRESTHCNINPGLKALMSSKAKPQMQRRQLAWGSLIMFYSRRGNRSSLEGSAECWVQFSSCLWVGKSEGLQEAAAQLRWFHQLGPGLVVILPSVSPPKHLLETGQQFGHPLTNLRGACLSLQEVCTACGVLQKM